MERRLHSGAPAILLIVLMTVYPGVPDDLLQFQPGAAAGASARPLSASTISRASSAIPRPAAVPAHAGLGHRRRRAADGAGPWCGPGLQCQGARHRLDACARDPALGHPLGGRRQSLALDPADRCRRAQPDAAQLGPGYWALNWLGSPDTAMLDRHRRLCLGRLSVRDAADPGPDAGHFRKKSTRPPRSTVPTGGRSSATSPCRRCQGVLSSRWSSRSSAASTPSTR